MKYCTKCGTQLSDTAKFCHNCGASIAPSSPAADEFVSAPVPAPTPEPNYSYGGSSDNNYTYSSDTHNSQSYSGTTTSGITQRNIAIAVVLSFVTCGIYMIYWMIRMNDEMNILVDDTTAPSGGMVFLLSLVTCGIYTYIWMYKMGEKCDKLKGVAGSSNILYLILTLFGLGIISYCLIQDTMNKYV